MELENPSTSNTSAKKTNLDVLVDTITGLIKPSRIENINLSHQILLVGKKRKKSAQKKKIKRKTTLTRKDFTELGLYTLPKKTLKYKDFLPLHELWQQYMINHLGLKNDRAPDIDEPNYDNFSKLLVKSDFHGAIVTVVRSKCPSLVGITGIVAMDTKNTFKIVGKDDKTRTVPKAESVFVIKLRALEFTIFGKHLSIRPAERSVKKIKNFMEPDL